MLKSRKKKEEEILQNYKETKKTEFDFERIELFFLSVDKVDVHQIISDRTFQDLDLEELFMYMDRTCSKIGQQYLYSTLRTVPKNTNRAKRTEKIIEFLKENPKTTKSSILELSRLNKSGAYFIQSLIYGTNIVKPKWFWVIPILALMSVVCLILSFFSIGYLAIFIPILAVNFIFHFLNKQNILTYSNSIPQLLILNKVADKMIRSEVILGNKDDVQRSNDVLSKISKLAVFFKLEAKLSSEFGQFIDIVFEWVKAAFVLEPILIFKIIKELESKRAEINTVFVAVAQVDVALSIISLRESLPYYGLPEFVEGKRSFSTKEIYHPLLLNPVSNSFDLSDGKSILITGSNMSGKTTFIRTVGINTILAQTINTTCAVKFVLPILNVYSACRINDNLLDDTSYYYEEVRIVKEMTEKSDSNRQNLFLLDELFKGTNTTERIASGKAVLSYLNRNKNLVFASTHDLELTEFLSDEYTYFHFEESIAKDVLTFDYKLKGGQSVNTNAIRILEINKFPSEITEEAKKLAKEDKQRLRNS